MSKSDRERRDAERAARRANRLAQRAQQRAERKEKQAQHATERAERLAERANRKPRRETDREESIEDLVDQVTEKWTRKAEEWIDEQSGKLFEEEKDMRAEENSITDLDSDMDDKFDDEFTHEQPRRNSSRASRRSKRSRNNKWKYGYNWDSKKWRFKNRVSRRSGNLYRDKRNKKICGVCAGAADYLGLETWQVRLIAVMGLVFIPSVAITVYFITYFLMDDKPYYRQVTDRFDDGRDDYRHDYKDDYNEEPSPVKRTRRARQADQPEMATAEVSNKETMKKAKEKFNDIEDRLRSMETHVTSSTFELQRELKKISGDDA